MFILIINTQSTVNENYLQICLRNYLKGSFENEIQSLSNIATVILLTNSWRTCLAECLIYRNKVELKFDNRLARVRRVLSNDVS